MHLQAKVQCPAIDLEMEVMTVSSTDKSELSPAARETTQAAAAAARVVKCEGVVFTVTEGNEVAQAARGGARAGQRELLRHGHAHEAALRGRAGEGRGDAVLSVCARGPALHRRRPEVFLGFN